MAEFEVRIPPDAANSGQCMIMNTLLKTLFGAALTVVAWRIVRSLNADSSRVDSSSIDQGADARNKHRRAIQRWENEGGKVLSRRRGVNEKRERRVSTG